MKKNNYAKGMSLLELMVALVLGLFMVGGIIAFFTATNSSARVQTGIARISENGRFASQVMLDDLRLGGAVFGTAFANKDANAYAVTSVNPIIVASSQNNLLPKWVTRGGATRSDNFPIDPGAMVQGYDCATTGICAPTLPTVASDVNVVPAVGVAVGNRAAGTDVLTVRFLRGVGSTLMDSFVRRETIPFNTGKVQVGKSPAGPPLNFDSGDFAMVASADGSEIFSTTIVSDVSGNPFNLSHETVAGNFRNTPHYYYRAKRIEGESRTLLDTARAYESRIYNFSKDFVSVTYFIGVLNDRQNPGQLNTGLYRIENGGVPELIVEGVERLDFRYGVQDATSRVHYLTADEVQSNPSNAPCIGVNGRTSLTGEWNNSLFDGDGTSLNNGCLWRGVRSIEVNLLVSSANLPAANLTAGDEQEPFRYSVDGTSLQVLSPTDTLVSGLAAGQRIRKEFAFTANLHSLNR